eukprot:c8959_g1_i2 orf=365-1207(+)
MMTVEASLASCDRCESLAVANNDLMPQSCSEESRLNFVCDSNEIVREVDVFTKDFISACNGMQKTTGDFVVPSINAFGNDFRVYGKECEKRLAVQDVYKINHVNQTYDFVRQMHQKHVNLDKAVMGIWECCELLNELVDESDPDLDEPQIDHLLQTAEAIRRDYPDEDWFPLTGLIHDLGKVLLHPRFGEESQWTVVGDTFPLGCAFDSRIVHSEYFKENPDYNNEKFKTTYGIYEQGCGLDKVVMSWGHDEYLYQVISFHMNRGTPESHQHTGCNSIIQ